MVWLRGSVSRYDDEVSTLREAIDRIGQSVGDDAEVAILNVLEFCNADGDEAAGLTHVLRGLPCLWVSSEHEAQDEHGRRWDLPLPLWLAPSEELALERAVAMRRSGRFVQTNPDGEIDCEGIWTDRGLELRERDMVSVFHHNRMVERLIARGDGPATRVLWPFPDRLGEVNAAMTLGARLVYQGDKLVEVDFNPWQTQRPAPRDWLETIAALDSSDSIERLVLLGVDVTKAQLLEAIDRLPKLHYINLAGGCATKAMKKAARAKRPGFRLL